MDHMFPKNGSKIFFSEGLDSGLGLELLQEIRFFAQAIPGPAGETVREDNALIWQLPAN